MKYVGILIPETNIVVEDEIIKIIGEDIALLDKISIHFSRIEVKEDYSINEKKFLNEVYKNAPKAIRLLEFIPLDIIGFFCTSTVLFQQLNNRSAFKELNKIPIIDSLQALIFACKKIKPKSVLLFSPYSHETSKALEKKLKNIGIPVSENINLNVKRDIDKYDLCRAKKMIMSRITKEMDLIIISCTNFRSLELITFFESKFGIPVISSNQALFWLLCKKLDVKIKSLKKYGILFEL